MSGTNTPKTYVSVHLVKLYKILLRLALGPIVSEIMKNKLFFPLDYGPTRTLRRFSWAGIHFPQILDQLVHTVETKKNDTRVLQRLDSSHGKCSYPGPEECFYRQWCYLSASMRLFLPTLGGTSNHSKGTLPCHWSWRNNYKSDEEIISPILHCCTDLYNHNW